MLFFSMGGMISCEEDFGPSLNYLGGPVDRGRLTPRYTPILL